ncbi:MAG: ABC transporter ATP-binding protein [Burkholderiaceae bacterium]|nr:ABC transporter ATP-binding protein [Burkholderiaceae bacterium]
MVGEPRPASPACEDEPLTATPILRTDGLVKRFGGLLATDHVDIDVVPGEVHALIGPNGAGKTTLITLLSGEMRPDAGSIMLDGRLVTRLDVAGRARAGLGRSYQITQVLMEFTALDNVLVSILARSRETGAWAPLRAAARHVEAALHYLHQVGLGESAEVPVTEMAHGERRQLELAMALALEPKVLLLDEPLAGVSKAESETIVGLLSGLRSRYPMLLVEHDMDAVFALADRISVLVYGKVVATGTPQAIRADASVRAAYLGDEEVQ